MLLQIPNVDTLSSLKSISNWDGNIGLSVLIGIILFGSLVYFIFKKAHKKEEAKIKTKLEKDIEIQETLIKNTEKANEPVIPENERQSREKYIGYNPINIFAQTEPLNYPYVLMPKTGSVIKFPRKGRVGRKGYIEEVFKTYIEKHFRSSYDIFDDRFILVKNSSKPYEPDFTLIDEKDGVNVFLDIEIDEPYEGINDIKKRQPTHYQYSDINRNNAFKNRGWVVIRFAEIQVYQEPNSCCRFIADVLKSINRNYNVPDQLEICKKVMPIRQWTKENAEKWSVEKYREKYLDIESFGFIENGQELAVIEETEIGAKTEEQIDDDIFIAAEEKVKTSNTKLEKIYTAINSNKYLTFSINNERTIVMPISITGAELTAFCYVKNKERTFSILGIQDVQTKDQYFTLKLTGPIIGLDKISSTVNTAIYYHKLIRMKYTRAEWTTYDIDKDTGEIIIEDRIEAEESIRTISNIQLAMNDPTVQDLWFAPDERHITAYCHRREAERMFRFDRIGEIEMLDL